MTTAISQQYKRLSAFFALLLLHQAAAYFVVRFFVPYLALGAAHVPHLNLGFSDWAQLLSAHLFLLTVVPTFLIALLLNRSLGHRSAVYVWIIPAVIFVFQFIFASPTVYPSMFFQSDFATAWRMWMGDGFHSRVNAFYQLTFTAPAYAGAAYSAGAWLGMRWSNFAFPLPSTSASA